MYTGIYSHIIEGFAALRCILAENDGVFYNLKKKKKNAKCATCTDVANPVFPFPVTLTGCTHPDQGHKLARFLHNARNHAGHQIGPQYMTCKRAFDVNVPRRC